MYKVFLCSYSKDRYVWDVELEVLFQPCVCFLSWVKEVLTDLLTNSPIWFTQHQIHCVRNLEARRHFLEPNLCFCCVSRITPSPLHPVLFRRTQATGWVWKPKTKKRLTTLQTGKRHTGCCHPHIFGLGTLIISEKNWFTKLYRCSSSLLMHVVSGVYNREVQTGCLRYSSRGVHLGWNCFYINDFEPLKYF